MKFSRLPLLLPALLATQISAFEVTWIAPGIITRFESTLHVPNQPSNYTSDDLHASIWPGIQTGTSPDIKLQNVIVDMGGKWSFWPEYCCSPDMHLQDSIAVYPGDLVTNIFIADRPSVNGTSYIDSVIITRGTQSLATGATHGQGSFKFDGSVYGNDKPMKTALVAVQFTSDVRWDFGQVYFENIIIETEDAGRDTSWCTNPHQSYHEKVWVVSPPQATVDADKGIVRCCLQGVMMNGP